MTNDADRNLFSHRLKMAMSIRQMRQVDIINAAKDLSKDIKIGSNNMSQYVRGRSIPTAKKLQLLARILNVNDYWLLGDSSQMDRTENQTMQDLIDDSDTIMLDINNDLIQSVNGRKVALLYARTSEQDRKLIDLILSRYEDMEDSPQSGFLQCEQPAKLPK